MQATCDNCKKTYTTIPSWYNRCKRHFCGRPCSFEFSRQRRVSQMRTMGLPYRFKPGHRTVRHNIPKGKTHYAWKGEGVGYRGLHAWLVRQLGTADKCSKCGKKRTTPRSIQWANIDGKYRRNVDDYIALCSSCHKLYDLSR